MPPRSRVGVCQCGHAVRDHDLDSSRYENWPCQRCDCLRYISITYDAFEDQSRAVRKWQARKRAVADVPGLRRGASPPAGLPVQPLSAPAGARAGAGGLAAQPVGGGSVMCMFDGGDGPAFYTESEPKARKPHRCCECHRAIELGERYERVSGKWEDRMDTFCTCLDCIGGARWWLKDNCDGWMFCMVLEDLEDHVDQFPDDRELMEAIWGVRSQWSRRDPQMFESVS